jgi:vacuolar-type H+-ATPase subunit B/Vma2
MKSAIGDKLTRKDHGDVSNQLVGLAFFAMMWRTLLNLASLNDLDFYVISTQNMLSVEMLRP